MPDTPPREHFPPGKGSGSGKASDHLANERTFLAWVRTCIAIISLGFVVAKFGVWLEEIARQTGASGLPPAAHDHENSAFIGAGMIVAGALLVPLAAWRHYRVGRAIEEGRTAATHWLVVLVSVLVLLLTAVLVGDLLNTMGAR